MSGSERTRRFYDDRGWKKEHGATLDQKLFGPKELGPIRLALQNLHIDRVKEAASAPGLPLNFLECGCGGNPRRELLPLCARYTGVDFSTTGLEVARSSFADVKVPHEFRLADVCALPFPSGTFDAAYKPMPIGWMRRRLERGGPVDLVTAGIATVGFYQNVSEFKPFGRLLWKSIAWLDVNFPGLAVYCGNYVMLVCRKRAAA